MLTDPRASALTTNFAGQWLRLQNLKNVSPDLFEYPDFDRTLADAMRRETELLFDSVVREDRNVLDLLTADYTFVNERLAKHYGIPNIMGSRFRRVALTDQNRFGLVGQASILTLTSTAIRTSPVQRGKYVMEVLLGTPPPPPPPPPNVPALPENAESRTGHVAKPLSVRQRLEEHRKNPNCAGCHKMMDPIGFSLENFDVLGVWRTNDSGFRIDPSGTMFDVAKLEGPASLRQAILGHSELFLQTFTENLLAYGVGRVLEPSDMPVVRSVAREAARNNNRFSALVLAIVKSTPFQMRRAEENIPAATDDVGANRQETGDSMFLTKKHLSRRSVLRGMGVTMALPLLDSMVPAQTPLSKTAAAPPARLACIEMVHGSAGATGEGTNKHYWSPEKVGRDFEMSQTLEPLAHIATI
jgi:hypothetical protein